jgi:tRNA threonylcarbamoyladenosine biosynthesis protein TsaE
MDGILDFTFFSDSPAATRGLGEKIGLILRPGSIFALVGELGSGKTLLTRGICAGLGVPLRQVNSPTFVLVNEYRGRFPVFHLDLYRLGDAEDIVDIGLTDYLRRAQEGLIVIEWAEKIMSLLPAGYMTVELDILSARKRKITLKSGGEKYDYLTEAIERR